MLEQEPLEEDEKQKTSGSDRRRRCTPTPRPSPTPKPAQREQCDECKFGWKLDEEFLRDEAVVCTAERRRGEILPLRCSGDPTETDEPTEVSSVLDGGDDAPSETDTQDCSIEKVTEAQECNGLSEQDVTILREK